MSARYLRSEITGLACTYGIQECIDESKRLFSEWMNDPTNNPIDPGLKGTVYCQAVANGGVEEWEFALQQYVSANVAVEKLRLLLAMSFSKQTWILSRYLEMAIDSNIIRRQEAANVIVFTSCNTIGRSLAWDFFRGNWDFLLNEFGAGPFAFTSMINSVTSTFNTEFHFSQLEDFVSDKPDLGSGARAFKQAKEKTRSNINWMNANVPILEGWLKNQGF